MPDWFNLQDPVTVRIVYAAIGIVLLVIVARVLNRLRDARYYARRRKEIRRTYNAAQLRQQELQRLGTRIIATSSTHDIAGFNVVRQIETVFTDGHPTPAKAVEILKALAAEKGANAIINLASERPPSGQCIARGDAVIVQALERRPRPAKGRSSTDAKDRPPAGPGDTPTE